MIKKIKYINYFFRGICILIVYISNPILAVSAWEEDSSSLNVSKDSLMHLLKTQSADSLKVITYLNLANSYPLEEVDKILSNSKKGYELSVDIQYPNGIAKASQMLGKSYSYLGLHDKALEYYFQTLAIHEQLKNEKEQAKDLNNIGSIYENLFLKDQALKSYNKALVLSEKYQMEELTSSILSNIALMYSSDGKLGDGEQLLVRCLQINRKLNKGYAAGLNLINLADIYRKKMLLQKAKDSLMAASRIAEDLNNSNLKTYVTGNLALVYMEMKEYAVAKEYCQQTLSLSITSKNKEMELKTFAVLAEIEYATGNPEGAYDLEKQLNRQKDSLYTSSHSQKIALMHVAFETEKHEQEKQELLKRSEEEEGMKNLYLTSGIILLLALIVAVTMALTIRKYNLRYRNANKLLEERNIAIEQQHQQIEQKNEELLTVAVQLEEQKNLIEVQNRKITDSIRSAKNVQTSMLMPEDRVKAMLSEIFILLLPKDIVSGDFYWLCQPEDSPHLKYIAAIDCTGHGVHGAFISVIANNLLTQIVKVQGLRDLTEIMHALHLGIQVNLHQSSTLNEDGLDISLVRLDEKNKKIHFAGIHNSLLYCLQGYCIEYKGTMGYIGGSRNIGKQFDVEIQEIPYRTDATYYLFSDGYKDQIGGSKRKKMGKNVFYDLLASISEHPTSSQKALLHSHIDSWIHTDEGDIPQMDDILIVGFKVDGEV